MEKFVCYAKVIWLLCLVQESKVLKFLGFMWNPLSWVMEAAAIMAIALANGGVGIPFFLGQISVRVFSVNGILILDLKMAGKASGLAGFCGYHHLTSHQLDD